VGVAASPPGARLASALVDSGVRSCWCMASPRLGAGAGWWGWRPRLASERGYVFVPFGASPRGRTSSRRGGGLASPRLASGGGGGGEARRLGLPREANRAPRIMSSKFIYDLYVYLLIDIYIYIYI